MKELLLFFLAGSLISSMGSSIKFSMNINRKLIYNNNKKKTNGIIVSAYAWLLVSYASGFQGRSRELLFSYV
jgi:hypothetical protein